MLVQAPSATGFFLMLGQMSLRPETVLFQFVWECSVSNASNENKHTLERWKSWSRRGVLAGSLLALASCQGALDGISQKANAPVPKKLINKMKAKNMAFNAPIMLRIFKQENTLEVWKQRRNGRYALLADYDICKWSGRLGPKFKEGDRQAPEGFYSVNKHQMNPNSQYHLSFNMGFPNAYDRSHGRTGTHLMVHGACSSAGCYSMTDEYVEEIYALARESFNGGQKAFQIQAFPFRLTAKNMIKHREHKHFAFWQMLKKGYDHFELTQKPPKVNVCERRYEFNTTSKLRYPSSGQCPARTMPEGLATAYVAKQKDYALKFEKLLARAERRTRVALTPITFETALPGVTVNTPATTPKDAKPDARSGTIVTTPKKPTIPQTTGSLEGVLKPAG